MEPHISTKRLSESRSLQGDDSHSLRDPHQTDAASNEQPIASFQPSRKGRLAAIGATVLILAAAAYVGYRVWSEQAEEKKSPDIGPIGGNASEDKPDGRRDPTKQIVKLSPEMVRKYGLRIGTARRRKLTAAIVAPARVAFNSEATAVVGTPVQGRAVEIRARAGDRVEAGSVLLEIESAELGEVQSDYLQRQTAAATARSSIKPLAEIFARIKQLHDESKLIGITEVQERELELHKAEGALATAEAAVAAARNKLHLLGMDNQAIASLESTGRVNSRYTIRSPFAGEVIERQVNLGELVKPDREKLFVVADTSVFWLWADVPEARAREVTLGCPAEITLTAAGERSFAGTVSHIAPSIDDATRALRVRIEVKSDPALRPGMFAQVNIAGKATGENAEPVVSVPETAIQSVKGSSAVFMPVNDVSDVFQARLVTTGDYADGMVGIVSGLDEGERIVTTGSAILKAELLKSSAKDED